LTKEELTPYVEKVKEAPTVCPELKEACEAYLHSDEAHEATLRAALLKEAKEDVNSIDDCTDFASSDAGKQILGEGAASMLEAAKKAKVQGEKYCLCPACQNGAKLIEVLS
jgi:hypothetical protein